MGLAKLREEQGLTQQDLADEAAISQPLVSMIETGQVRPWANLRKRIAQGLGASASEIWPELEDPDGD